MKYDEILSFLRSKNSSRYSLENLEDFFAVSRFHYSVPTIHVTATNGKGSIVNYISNIYIDAGYKVGTFISPQRQLTQMILVNGVGITTQEIERVFNIFFDDFVRFDLTEFEIQTVIALYFISQNNADIAVIEVGMGGANDATNVIESTALAVIGKVGLEHSRYLGRSETEIANSKAGIIKFGIPTLTVHQDEAIERAIREVAKKQKSSLLFSPILGEITQVSGSLLFDGCGYKNLEVNSRALYQVENASISIEAVKILNGRFPVTESNIRNGLRSKTLAGRFTVLNKFPRIIIDGAHNPDGVQTLLRTLNINRISPKEALFSSFLDKNIDKMLAYLGAEIPTITLTTFNNDRARGADDYFLFADEYHFVADFSEILAEYMVSSDDNSILLVCGSLDFAYEVIEYLEARD